MQVHQNLRNFFNLEKSKQSKKSRFIAVMGTLSMLGATLGVHTVTPDMAHAATNTVHTTTADTASAATRCAAKAYTVSWLTLASVNNIANPNLIFVDQKICIDNTVASRAAQSVSVAPKAPAPVQTPVPAPAVPTPTPAPAVPAPAATQSTDINGMIDEIFGSYAAGAKHIAMCESGMNPNATNSNAIGGSHAAGLFQILYPSTWNTTSQAGMSPYNARANIIAAHDIFVRDGYSWREWTCQ